MGSDFNSNRFNDQMRKSYSVRFAARKSQCPSGTLGIGLWHRQRSHVGCGDPGPMHLAKHTMITVIAVECVIS